jgi:two-component system sensor histidine kinase YesM
MRRLLPSFRFRFRSISVLVYLAVVSLLTAVLLYTSTGFFQRVLLDSLMVSADENLKKSIEMLDIKLQSVHQISYGLTHNAEIQSILQNIDFNQQTPLELQNDLRAYLLNYCRVSDSIYSVNVFRDGYNLAGNRFKFDQLEQTLGFGLSNDSLLDSYNAAPDGNVYPYKDAISFGRFYNEFLETDTVASFDPVVSAIDKTPIGTLNINIRADYLFKHLNPKDARYKGWTYVIDGQGSILYSSAEPEADQSLLNPIVGKILKQRLGNVRETVHGEDSYAVFRSVGTIDWIIVDIIPYHEIMGDFEAVRNQILLVSLLLTALFTLVYTVASTLFIKPVHDIEKNLIQMQSGDLGVTAKSSYLLEIDRLSKNFNAMVGTIKRLLEDVKSANKREREAELIALQSQINPHFLYNTLDIIYWTTDQEEIATISHQLGKFFRLSLNRGRKVILVQDEIEQVKVYLNIQAIRFKDKFTYVVDVDPALLDKPMMNLILQPIVENALLHGLKYKQTGGLIKISGQRHDKTMCLEVQDNGTGVDLDRIREILSGQEEIAGYGIRNVHERIQLKYGAQFGLSYRNLDTGGAIASICIPLLEQAAAQPVDNQDQ